VSLLHKRDLSGYYGEFPGATANQLIPPRNPVSMVGSVLVSNDTALRHSAVWASLRLRANLISTMPIDCYRRVGQVQIEVPKPPVLVMPGGEQVDDLEWRYSSQFDLDRGGNVFGLITERSGFGGGLPARIDLQPLSTVSVEIRDGKLWKYRFGNELHDPADVWHEKQYTVSGFHVGLSPVAYAAWTIGKYLSIQEFALGWFGGGGIPSGILTNKAQKTIPPGEARDIKERFKAAVANRDIFVTGGDWTYSMAQAEQAGSNWLEAEQQSVADIARFFDVPGDIIDAAVQSSTINYANAVQRNLQLLIMNIGPAVIRRERALSRLLPAPRYVKLNTDALLRMDPKTVAEMLTAEVAGRLMAPSEARELMNRAPYTDGQLAEFDRLFGSPRTQPATAATGG
jgi:HK97 family phage portal protein